MIFFLSSTSPHATRLDTLILLLDMSGKRFDGGTRPLTWISIILFAISIYLLVWHRASECGDGIVFTQDSEVVGRLNTYFLLSVWSNDTAAVLNDLDPKVGKRLSIAMKTLPHSFEVDRDVAVEAIVLAGFCVLYRCIVFIWRRLCCIRCTWFWTILIGLVWFDASYDALIRSLSQRRLNPIESAFSILYPDIIEWLIRTASSSHTISIFVHNLGDISTVRKHLVWQSGGVVRCLEYCSALATFLTLVGCGTKPSESRRRQQRARQRLADNP